MVHYDTVVYTPEHVEPNADLVVIEEVSEPKKYKDSIVEGSCESPVSLKFNQRHAYSTKKMSELNLHAPMPISTFVINKVDQTQIHLSNIASRSAA